MENFLRLAVALAVGLLIGTERGWQERASEEGRRIAGIRTFGLISLLGALWAILSEELGEVLLGFAFLAFAALMIAAHVVDIRSRRDQGITTIVAAFMTFVLGAVSMQGHLIEAGASAVIATLLLGLKPLLHEWLRRLERRELFAMLKLLLISVVLLPILPDEGYGPWGVINPYIIWWWVVLIAAISFVGYFAVKLMGARQGIMITGLFGGLASSTAVTLNFSRLSRTHQEVQPLLAAGIVIAAATLFPRALLEVAIVNHQLLPYLFWPMAAMALVSYLLVFILWRAQRSGKHPQELKFTNPFELLSALQFGALLVVVVLLSRAFQSWFGDLGIYLVAAFAAISDVDAITLSLAHLALGDLSQVVAAQAILIATLVNTVAKGLLVALIGGPRMAARVGLVFITTILVGAVGFYLLTS